MPPLVLFVSYLNTGASIMAEAILRHAAGARARAASAGESGALAGQEGGLRSAFEETYGKLYAHMERFLALEWERLDDHALSEALGAVAEQ